MFSDEEVKTKKGIANLKQSLSAIPGLIESDKKRMAEGDAYRKKSDEIIKRIRESLADIFGGELEGIEIYFSPPMQKPTVTKSKKG